MSTSDSDAAVALSSLHEVAFELPTPSFLDRPEKRESLQFSPHVDRETARFRELEGSFKGRRQIVRGGRSYRPRPPLELVAITSSYRGWLHDVAHTMLL